MIATSNRPATSNRSAGAKRPAASQVSHTSRISQEMFDAAEREAAQVRPGSLMSLRPLSQVQAEERARRERLVSLALPYVLAIAAGLWTTGFAAMVTDYTLTQCVLWGAMVVVTLWTVIAVLRAGLAEEPAAPGQTERKSTT